MFFELASNYPSCRKNILRVFYHVAQKLGDSFDVIMESAEGSADA